MRARGFRLCSFTARSLATSIAAAPSQFWLEIPAVMIPPSCTVRRPARPSSEVPGRIVSSAASSSHRRDFIGEPAVVGRRLRALVAGNRERFHLGAGHAPLGGDHLRRIDLVQHAVAIARDPAGRGVERVVEAIGLAGQHRRRDRDRVHRLAAARDDQILRPAHHALRGKVDGLLARSALPVDRGAGHVLRAARRPARRCGRCRPPAARWYRSSPRQRRLPDWRRSRCARPAP
jgi:hypothetical protein